MVRPDPLFGGNMRSSGSHRRDLAEKCHKGHMGNTMEKSKNAEMAARIIMPKVIEERPQKVWGRGKNNPHQNQDIFLRGEQISPLSHKRLTLCCKLRKKTGFYSPWQTFPLFHLVLISAKIDDKYQKSSQEGDISKSAQPALWLSPWQWGSRSCFFPFHKRLSWVWHRLTTLCLCSSPAKTLPFLCSRPVPSVPSCFSSILESPG